MAKLAIKGDPKRFAEIIDVLSMFGGVSDSPFKCSNDELYYYIAPDGKIYGSGIEYEDISSRYKIFTLDEFKSKFPFKVGDKVVYKNYDDKEDFEFDVIDSIVNAGWVCDKVYYGTAKGHSRPTESLRYYRDGIDT